MVLVKLEIGRREMEAYESLIWEVGPIVLKCPKIVGANSLFVKIASVKSHITPVLNTPLRSEIAYAWNKKYSFGKDFNPLLCAI